MGMIIRPFGLSCLNRSGGAKVAAQVTDLVSISEGQKGRWVVSYARGTVLRIDLTEDLESLVLSVDPERYEPASCFAAPAVMAIEETPVSAACDATMMRWLQWNPESSRRVWQSWSAQTHLPGNSLRNTQLASGRAPRACPALEESAAVP